MSVVAWRSLQACRGYTVLEIRSPLDAAIHVISGKNKLRYVKYCYFSLVMHL